jgi:hypothetical protein
LFLKEQIKGIIIIITVAAGGPIFLY